MGFLVPYLPMQGWVGPSILVGQSINLFCNSRTLFLVDDNLSIKKTWVIFVLILINS